MSFKSFLTLILASIVFMACDDNTSTLGIDMMPSANQITTVEASYDVNTRSYEVGDSVLARTSTSYLGRFTDPVTGTTVKSDYLTQLYCPDNTVFYDNIAGDSIFATVLSLSFSDFVGDSLTNMEIEVYELDSLLDANNNFYTNIDPEKFIKPGAKPVGQRMWTAADRTVNLKERDSLYTINKVRTLQITLDNEIGKEIFKAFKKDSTVLKSASNWQKSGLRGSKGFYCKLKRGDGAMAYITTTSMHISYGGLVKDSVMVVHFSGTEEVVQATRFENNNIHKLMEDTDATYLKSPAGIFTLAELPVEQISYNDTINSASISFTRYNDSAYSLSSAPSDFRLSIPKSILMVRLDDYLNGYFEKYKLNDDITSYVASYNSSTNTYSYHNISRLISTMLQERKNGTASENYNKVLLIPIEATRVNDTSTMTETARNKAGNIVKINHDFSMSSSRLVGGAKDAIKLNIIYSKFE